MNHNKVQPMEVCIRHRSEPPSIGFWRHQPMLDQQAQSLAEATLAFHDAVGGDWVKLTPAGTYQAHALGLQDCWEGDFLGRRHITSRPIAKAEDWLGLKASDLGQQEINCLHASEWLLGRLPAGTPLLATVFSPLSQALQLAGAESLTTQARQAPELVRHGIDRIAQRTSRLIDAYRRAGVSGIYYVSQHHAIDVLPGPQLHAWGDDADCHVLQAAAGLALNIMHFHGAPLMTRLPALPPRWRVHFEFTRDNTELMMRMSPSQPLIIGLTFETLRRGADPDFRQATIAQLRAQQGSGPLYLGAACVLPLDFPLDLAAAWVQTAKAP